MSKLDQLVDGLGMTEAEAKRVLAKEEALNRIDGSATVSEVLMVLVEVYGSEADLGVVKHDVKNMLAKARW